MNSIFEPTTKSEILRRIDSLTPQSQALWGKMSVSQMLKHCSEGAGLATGALRAKRSFIGRTIGPFFKSLTVNEKPFSKNSPTLPQLVITGDPDFEKERAHLRRVVEELSDGGPSKTGVQPHPFFGKLEPEAWGTLSYKHLDHHLRQFGV